MSNFLSRLLGLRVDFFSGTNDGVWRKMQEVSVLFLKKDIDVNISLWRFDMKSKKSVGLHLC